MSAKLDLRGMASTTFSVGAIVVSIWCIVCTILVKNELKIQMEAGFVRTAVYWSAQYLSSLAIVLGIVGVACSRPGNRWLSMVGGVCAFGAFLSQQIATGIGT